VFLDYKTVPGLFLYSRWRLGGVLELPFALVFFQCHSSTLL
jgi:hypothetical protein